MSCNFTEILCDSVSGNPVVLTGVLDPVNGGFAVGPVLTNLDGTTFTGNVTTLEYCSTGSTASPFACADLASCSIEALGDVGSFTPTTGDVLQWNGTQWVSGTITATGFVCTDLNSCPVDSLSDVDTTTVAPVIDQIMQWNGTNWVPATILACTEIVAPNGATGVNCGGCYTQAQDILTYAPDGTQTPEDVAPAAGFIPFWEQCWVGLDGQQEDWIVLEDVNGDLQWHQRA